MTCVTSGWSIQLPGGDPLPPLWLRTAFEVVAAPSPGPWGGAPPALRRRAGAWEITSCWEPLRLGLCVIIAVRPRLP